MKVGKKVPKWTLVRGYGLLSRDLALERDPRRRLDEVCRRRLRGVAPDELDVIEVRVAVVAPVFVALQLDPGRVDPAGHHP